MERQLTEAREALRRLRVRLQGRNGHARRHAAIEDREWETADQMDELLWCAEGMHRSASRGVPLGPLVGSSVDVTVGRDFRQVAFVRQIAFLCHHRPKALYMSSSLRMGRLWEQHQKICALGGRMKSCLIKTHQLQSHSTSNITMF
ncbi:hypothetical protein CKAN_00157400 [Cinnamomum micranthum f. kanehirae]|uniref:Uncharacterized protein n=1 Tax=Cinnamomum micranthum f. kanehirae TaxID=337451 RepID=A0A3S3MR39_9MAGN|nr:hypothetical protein CKAN_00157400 [Cinnamomum micranthum f. kanehirae]